MKEFQYSAFVVGVAICSPTYVLLIMNHAQTGRELLWKFPVESSKLGELPLDGLVRALWEEAGLRIRVVYNEAGFIEEIGDETMKVESVRPGVTFYKGLPYEHHFYKVTTTDARLLDLSGKNFPGADPDEEFETQAFKIADAWSNTYDFLEQHLWLYKEFLLSRAA